jgi:hypothetical protein
VDRVLREAGEQLERRSRLRQRGAVRLVLLVGSGHGKFLIWKRRMPSGPREKGL